jgi:hypothetical protein
VAAHPEEPLPALVLVAEELSAGERLRLEAILTVGRRLGIAALVLKRCQPLPTVVISNDGMVADEPEGSLRELRDARSFYLTAEEAAELLAVVDAGRGQGDDVVLPDPEGEPFPVEEAAHGGRIEVRLFGVYTIEVAGEEIRTGLRSKARELLAFLLLHPSGASAEACVDAVWPNADLARGLEGFRTSVGNLRKAFRNATGDPKANVLARVGEHYRVDAELFDCDVWRFRGGPWARELGVARGAREGGSREPGKRVLRRLARRVVLRMVRTCS